MKFLFLFLFVVHGAQSKVRQVSQTHTEYGPVQQISYGDQFIFNSKQNKKPGGHSDQYLFRDTPGKKENGPPMITISDQFVFDHSLPPGIVPQRNDQRTKPTFGDQYTFGGSLGGSGIGNLYENNLQEDRDLYDPEQTLGLPEIDDSAPNEDDENFIEPGKGILIPTTKKPVKKPYEWVKGGSAIPKNAVTGGISVYGDQIYVGRASINGVLQPIEIFEFSNGWCTQNGKPVKLKEFEILTADYYKWLPVTDGKIPPNAIPAGTKDVNSMFIGRVWHNDELAIGTVDPATGELLINYMHKIIRYKIYEILVKVEAKDVSNPEIKPIGFDWVEGRSGVPKTTVTAGITQNGKQVYVGRANTNGELQPVEIFNHSNGWNTQNGKPIKLKEFEFLTAGKYKWLPIKNGRIPANVINAGIYDVGSLLIGRAWYKDKLAIGKVDRSTGELRISYMDKTIAHKIYEILVEEGTKLVSDAEIKNKDYNWIKGSSAVPKDVVTGGISQFGNQVYVGRFSHHGALQPIEIFKFSNAWCTQNGKPVKLKQFEFLTANYYKWLPVRNGKIPKKVIEAGTGEVDSLFIGRVWHNDELRIGKVNLLTGELLIPYMDEILGYKMYEILVEEEAPYASYSKLKDKAYDWLKGSSAVPEHAITGGMSQYGKQVYVGRATFSGISEPIEIFEHSNAWCTQNGKPIKLKEFEFLTANYYKWLPVKDGKIPSKAREAKTKNVTLFLIGRVWHNDELAIGKVNLLTGELRIPYEDKTIGHKIYEILVEGEPDILESKDNKDYDWVKGSSVVPKDAVTGGMSQYGKQVFVGRTINNGVLQPIEIFKHSNGWCTQNGKPIKLKEFEFLVANYYKWLPVKDGKIPSKAIEAVTNNVDSFLIGRVWHDDKVAIGKVDLSTGELMIPIEDKMVGHKIYEILVQEGAPYASDSKIKDYDWVTGSSAVPKDAVTGGISQEGNPMYVGRASINGVLQPFEIFEFSNGWSTQNGKPVKLKEFEFITASDYKWLPVLKGKVSRYVNKDGTKNVTSSLIGRVWHNDKLAIGKVNLSTGELMVPIEDKMVGYKLYEILVKEQLADALNTEENKDYDWVKGSSALPEHAVTGGMSQDGKQVFVGRAVINGVLQPIEIFKHSNGWSTQNGKPIKLKEFEILSTNYYKWLPVESGQMPAKVIEDVIKNVDSVLIGRVWHDDKLAIGKVDLSTGELMIPIEDKMVGYKTYEILVEGDAPYASDSKIKDKDFEWVSSNGEVPENAVTGGISQYGKQIFVGRAAFNGILEPIEIFEHSNGWSTQNGKPIQLKEFEFITANDYKWLPVEKGKVPRNVIEAGPKNIASCLIGRVWHNDKLAIGKVDLSTGELLIPYMDKIIGHKVYEILVDEQATDASESEKEKGYEWFSSNGEVPKHVVTGRTTKDGRPVFIGRSLYNGTYQLVEIVGGIEARPIQNNMPFKPKEVEILYANDYKWEQVTSKKIPKNAIPVGTNYIDSFIGRVWHNNAYTIGKVDLSTGQLMIPFGDTMVGYKNYEILVKEKLSDVSNPDINPKGYEWVYSNGEVPKHVITAGRTEDGLPIFIGRSLNNGTSQLVEIVGGLEARSLQTDKPFKTKEYEVLYGDIYKWMPVKNGTISANAKPLGINDNSTFIGRVWHNDKLAIGKVDLLTGELMIPIGDTMVGYKNYELLLKDKLPDVSNPENEKGYEWVSSNGKVPKHVVAGSTSKDGRPMLIGRSFHNGTFTLVEIVGGAEAKGILNNKPFATKEFDVLYADSYKWDSVIGGKIPQNAIPIGKTQDNSFYIGGVWHNNEFVVGTVDLATGKLMVPIEDKMVGYKNYEILVDKKLYDVSNPDKGYEWVSNNGKVPKHVVTGGISQEGTPVLLGRAIYDGIMQPVEIVGGIEAKGTHNDKPFTTTEFEYLYANNYKWDQVTNGKIPADALEVGKNHDNSLFFGRVWHNNAYAVGTVDLSTGELTIQSANKLVVYKNFEILVGESTKPKRRDYEWVSSNGEVPEHAVSGGISTDGHPLYVGSAIYAGTIQPVEILQSVARGTKDGKPFTTKEFEYLFGNNYKWEPQIEGTMQECAIPVGINDVDAFIGRVWHNNTYAIGKVVPSTGELLIPYMDVGYIAYMKYEILIKEDANCKSKYKGYKWIFKSDEVFKEVVTGGTSRDGHPLFVGRALYNGIYEPVEIFAGTNARGTQNGKTFKTQEFEILYANNYKWAYTRDGIIPKKAIPAESSAIKPLYFGRVWHNNAYAIGKVVASTGELRIPYLDIGYFAYSKYEILVEEGSTSIISDKDYAWVNGEDEIPENAVVGGTSKEGNPIYVGRALHKGLLLPVEIFSPCLAWGVFKGEAFRVEHFEFLTMEKYKWMFKLCLDIPRRAIPGGRNKVERLYIGRAMMPNNETAIGTVVPSTGELLIPYMNKVVKYKKYEILLLK